MKNAKMQYVRMNQDFDDEIDSLEFDFNYRKTYTLIPHYGIQLYLCFPLENKMYILITNIHNLSYNLKNIEYIEGEIIAKFEIINNEVVLNFYRSFDQYYNLILTIHENNYSLYDIRTMDINTYNKEIKDSCREEISIDEFIREVVPFKKFRPIINQYLYNSDALFTYEPILSDVEFKKIKND